MAKIDTFKLKISNTTMLKDDKEVGGIKWN